jgi:hypothetical protein
MPHCPQIDGELNGAVTEYNDVGGVRFKGIYHSGVRHGSGCLYLVGGGRLEGKWVNGGEIAIKFQKYLLYFSVNAVSIRTRFSTFVPL